jgi:hypothetical protein
LKELNLKKKRNSFQFLKNLDSHTLRNENQKLFKNVVILELNFLGDT